MNIKAIMCDVDGTLLNSQQVVSPFTIEMIKAVHEKGILFGLATGRDAKSVESLLKPWGIAGLVDVIVGNGGADIYDYTLSIKKANFPLDGALIKDIINHYQDMNVNFTIPKDGILFSPKDDDFIAELAKADGVPYQVVDFDEFLKEPRAKLVIIANQADMEQVIARSKTFSNDQYKCASLKTASTLFEYMDPRVTKTHGLEEVMAMHHLTMNELCTFGDADNDYDMTLNAGIGVVMANGSEKTKIAADYITEDNNHDGIGLFIQKYIL